MVPETHEGRCGCLRCLADRGLTDDDWRVVEFYLRVQDQLVNLTPGTDKPVLAPRLEAWLAVAAATETPMSRIEAARHLHAYVSEQARERGVHRILSPSAFEPPEMD